MRQIKGLTGFRWWAAFLVFLFHVDMPQRTPLTWLPWRIESLIQQGRVGVTVFFILSGFVLAYSHQRDFKNTQFQGWGYYGKFMLKRIARLYPVYLVGLLATLALSIRLSSVPDILVIAADALMVMPYWPFIAMQWYGSGVWSVANELFFYLTFPLAFPLLLRVRRVPVLIAILVFCSLFGVVSALSALPNPLHNDGPLRYAFPPLRLAEFVAGIAAAVLTFRWNWRVPGWLAVGLIGVTAVYLSYAAPLLHSTVMHNWLVVPAVLAVLNALSQEKVPAALRWLESPLMVYLGKVSYSFFVAQIPLALLLDSLVAGGRISSHNAWVLPVGFGLNLLGAIVLHHFVEEPAQKWVTRKLRNEPSQNVTAVPL